MWIILFIVVMMTLAILTKTVEFKFDSIPPRSIIMYYEDDLQIYDQVVYNYGGALETKLGKVFNYWDYMAGTFWVVKSAEK